MKKIVLILLLVAVCISLTSCALQVIDVIVEQVQQSNDTQQDDFFEDQDQNQDNPEHNDTVDFGEILLESGEIELDILVVDNEECLIKITGLEIDGQREFAHLNVYFENKSDDMTYLFRAEDTNINGVFVNSSLYATVAPGKKDNARAIFLIESFTRNGLEAITDFEMTFVLTEEGNFDDTILTEYVRFYPYGEQNATKFERTPKESDVVVLDNEYVTVIFTDYLQDDYFYMIDYYIINKTGKPIKIYTSDTSINDYMYSLYVYTYLPADASVFDKIDIYKAELKRNNIETLEEIELRIIVEDEETYSIIGKTDYITISSKEFGSLYNNYNYSGNQLEDEQDEVDEEQLQASTPTDIIYEKPFGSYIVPSDWQEDTGYYEGVFTYIHEDDIFGFETVSAGYIENGYALEEHEEFRDEVLNTILTEVNPEDYEELLGEGFITDNGYNCYLFTIVIDENSEYLQAFIIGDYKYVLVDHFYYIDGLGEQSTEVFHQIINSFTWNESM